MNLQRGIGRSIVAVGALAVSFMPVTVNAGDSAQSKAKAPTAKVQQPPRNPADKAPDAARNPHSGVCHSSDCPGCKYTCTYMGGGCLCIDKGS
jgi:hypothetical protein